MPFLKRLCAVSLVLAFMVVGVWGIYLLVDRPGGMAMGSLHAAAAQQTIQEGMPDGETGGEVCAAQKRSARQMSSSPQGGETVAVAVLSYGGLSAAGEFGKMDVATFHRQMRYLQEKGYRVISAEEWCLWREGKCHLPKRCVLLTFREADLAFAQYALPVLRQYGYPYVLFVDQRCLTPTEGFLRVEHLRMLVQQGASIGSATMNCLTVERWEAAGLEGADRQHELMEQELGNCSRRICDLFGDCPLLLYPNGYTSPEMVEHVAAFGHRYAFLSREGKNDLQTPDFMLLHYRVSRADEFCRAVNFGEDGQVSAMRRELDAVALPEGSPGTAAWQAESALAADLSELPDPEFADAFQSVPASYGDLGRRGGTGDWVTSRFAQPLVARDKTRVAVLGYHNFSNTRSVSDMRMRTAEFCTQMQYLHDAGIAVISMQDFLEWRCGRRLLPERCALITIDDGWKSVYTDAFPVLRAYGYPFTLFLYTAYVNVQGDSMSYEMIQDLLAHGGTLGSHSTRHLYPKSWKRLVQESPAYSEQIRHEILDSRDKLMSLFPNSACTTYCYPGGYHTQPMVDALGKSAYKAAFTVLEGKVSCHEPRYAVHRYMILGTVPAVFRRAVAFEGSFSVEQYKADMTVAEARARMAVPKAFSGAAAPSAAVRAAIQRLTGEEGASEADGDLVAVDPDVE